MRKPAGRDLLLVDVGIRPDPANDLPVRVTNRNAFRQEPPIGLVAVPPQPDLALVDGPLTHCLVPSLGYMAPVARLDQPAPAVSLDLLDRGPGELMKAAVEPFDPPIRTGFPNLVGHCFHEGAKLLLAGPQSLLGQLPLSHIAVERDDAAGNRAKVELQPPVLVEARIAAI